MWRVPAVFVRESLRLDASPDVAFLEILVVLFAGVLHDFPLGAEVPGALADPRLGVGLGVDHGQCIGDVSKVGAGVALDGVELIADRVTDGIDARQAVESDGVDNEGLIVLPLADGVAIPGGIGIFGVRTAIDRSDMEPAVLLPELGEILIVLDELDGVGSAD